MTDFAAIDIPIDSPLIGGADTPTRAALDIPISEHLQGLVNVLGVITPSGPVLVTNISPSDGMGGPGTIGPLDPFGFDITTTPGGLLRVIVAIWFEDLNWTELAHDGDDFLGAYKKFGTRASITNGYRYRLLRAPIWPAKPKLRIFGFNMAGGEL